MGRGLAPEWRRWLIENLLLAVKPARLMKVLAGAGLSEAAARAAIEREIGDPCLRGGFRATSTQRKLEGLLRAYGALHRQAPWHQDVERRRALTAEELLRRYALRGRPVIAGDAIPAMVGSGGLRLREPRLWIGGPASGPPRRAAADLLVYQVLGKRPLELIPWPDFLRVQGRMGERRRAAVSRDALRVRVRVEAGEALLIPVGWWHRPAGPASGAAVCYQVSQARAPAVAWRGGGAIAPTAPPRTRAWCVPGGASR